MRAVKPEIRVLGVDDAPFSFEDETTSLIGTVFRGGRYLEAVLKRDVVVDGLDVTDQILDMVNGSRHTDQIQVVLLDGITFAGFNIADLDRISSDGDVAVVAVSRTEPDLSRMRNGLSNVDSAADREQLIRAAGAVQRHQLPEGELFFQFRRVTEEQAHEILDRTCVRGLVPEPVRVAHLIAAALKTGESKGGA